MNWQYVPLSSWQELYALDGFLALPVDPAVVRLGRAVQPYSMSQLEGERPCGIKGCSEGHLHGWLVLLSDGAKTNVGRVCGFNVFGLAWAAQMSSARAVRRAYNKREALNRVRESARAAAEEKVEALGPSFETARAMEAAFYRIPAAIRESLLARAQGNEPAIMTSRPPNVREIAEAKEKNRRVPDRIEYVGAHLRGLAALRRSGHLDGALSAARGKAADLARLATSDAATSDEITEGLRELRECREKLLRVPELWQAFFDADNVANLSYLHACKKLGFATVRLNPDTFEISFT